MRHYISASLRKQVAERANFCCEYCLAYEGHSFIKFQIEHIISKKHGGLSTLENLAYSCFYCNNHKGTDLGTILQVDLFVRFFHPRKDKWSDHFSLDAHMIMPKTEIGQATIKILQINAPERLTERLALLEVQQYPHENALKII